MDYLSFGKIFNLTNKQKKILRNGVCPDEVQRIARKIFNKKTNLYVTILGDITEKYIPSIDYFKENFLISESEL